MSPSPLSHPLMFHEFREAEQHRLDEFRSWYAGQVKTYPGLGVGPNLELPLVMTEKEWYKRYITWLQTELELELEE